MSLLLNLGRRFSGPILDTLSWKPFPAADLSHEVLGVRELTPDESIAAVRRYHADVPVEVVGFDSPQGLSVRKSDHRTTIEAQWKRFKRQLREGRASSSDKVKARYEVGYKDSVSEWDIWAERRLTHLRVGESYVVRMNANASVPVRADKLAEVFKALGVGSACEIGSGSGVNLFCLAARVPDVALTGLELSAAGTEASSRSKMLPLHETAFGRWCRIGAADLPAIQRVALRQGSAFEIPSADGSHDLLFTVAALEQMAANWKQALREIRRVTRRYAVFYEFFRDFASVNGYLRNVNVNYFRQSIAAIEAQGFRRVAVLDNFPTSIVHGASMLIFEKA